MLSWIFRALRLGGVLTSPQAAPSGLQMTPPSHSGTENPKSPALQTLFLYECIHINQLSKLTAAHSKSHKLSADGVRYVDCISFSGSCINCGQLYIACLGVHLFFYNHTLNVLTHNNNDNHWIILDRAYVAF